MSDSVNFELPNDFYHSGISASVATTSWVRNIQVVLRKGAVLSQCRGAGLHHDQENQHCGGVRPDGEACIDPLKSRAEMELRQGGI